MFRQYVGTGEEKITLRSMFGPYRKGKYWERDIVDAIEKNDYLSGDAHYFKFDKFKQNCEVGTQMVLVDYTETSFGGYRLWLVCRGCYKRRTYLVAQDNVVKCRECWGMLYASQYGSRLERPFIRACKLHNEFCNLVDSSHGYFTYAGKPTKRSLKIQRSFETANAAVKDFCGELDKPDYFAP